MTVEMSYYAMKTLQADTLTPIGIYKALEGEYTMLFESNAKHDDNGRYSFIVCNPIAQAYGDAQKTMYRTFYPNSVQQLNESVLDVIARMMPKVEAKLPFSFFGGLVGHFNYETAFHVERIGELLEDERDIPDVHVLFYQTFVVFDHLLEKVSIVAIDLFNIGISEQMLDVYVKEIEEKIMQPVYIEEQLIEQLAFEPQITKDTFIQMVEKAKEHVYSGDVFQIVLSQRFESTFKGEPFELYRRLRNANPSPYMFYMNFHDYTILGTSPESLVKIQDDVVATNPIAGTRKRGATKAEDEQLAAELLADEKEIAEHKMLVDLGRNDIGKVSEIGSVNVTKYMDIEKYQHVMHIVSEVKGKLAKGLTAIDVIKATLPAGTVSGAPKIRAMQLLNEMESVRRGVYAGAIGYISIQGNMDLALAIRTMVVQNGKAYVQAGAGVVYDSVPESEYEETLNKARALLEVRK